MQLTESRKHIQQGIKLTDKSFKQKLAANFRLTVYLNNDQLIYTVTDILSRKLLHLQSSSFFHILNNIEYNNALRAMILNDEVLHLGYGKKQIFYLTDCFTLVPNKIFTEENAVDFLAFNQFSIEGKNIYYNDLKFSDAKFVFGVEKETEEVLSKSFSAVEIKSASAQLLNTLLSKHAAGETVYCYVQPSTLQLLYIKDASMKFFNLFSYKTPEDFIYFLMNAFHLLGLDKESVPLVFIGELIQDSAIYKLAYKYVRNVRFGELPKWVERSTEMKFSPHFYFNLFSYEP